jgi:putative DNA primase/helicase
MSEVFQNYDDVVEQMQAFGLVIDGLEVGRLMRCKVEGDRERRGWYALHEVRLDNGSMALVGAYGIWRGSDNNAQKIELKKAKLTDEQRAAIKARIAEDKKRADARRKAEIERAAALAQRGWEHCKPDGSCDYLTRKNVKAYGVRFTDRGNMVVPLLDVRGRIYGLQVIYNEASAKRRRGRDKEYWPSGMTTKAMHYQINSPEWIVLVCEGYATGASLHEATGYPVAIAFDAGNLLPVAQALHKRYPWVRILVCADDDYLARCPSEACAHFDLVSLGNCPKCSTPYRHGNSGVESADAAALAVNGAWVKPTFAVDRALQKITDFNDLHTIEGLHAVRAQIEARIAELRWDASTTVAREELSRGAGDTSALKPLLTVPEAAVRYSIVYGGGGCLFDHQERELVPKGDVMDLLEDHGWRDWKRHPRRSVVRLREIGFDPAGADPTIKCNLWGGWPTTPKAGKCTVLLELLEHLCSGEQNAGDVYEWVLKWLAYPIQHPGAKMKTALIFHGPQGVGKNMFFEAVMDVYGKYGRIVDQAAIEDKFNDWASKKLFLIADEVVARQELFHTKNKLKGFVTGKTIRINPKNIASHDEVNHVNVVFLSNEIQPLVLERDDRRHTVIWTPATLSQNFYTDVADEIAGGGIAALHHHLATLDLGDFQTWTRPPMTKSKSDLIELSLESTQRFLADWEKGETPYPFGPAKNMDLYAAYTRWCRQHGVSKPRESGQFLAYIGKLPGWTNQPRHVYENTAYHGSTKPKRIVIPDAASLSRAGKECQADWARSEWLTNHVVAFAMSLEDLPQAANG